MEYVVGDLLALPFRDGSFDAVSARYVIDHVADPARALDEIRRVLRPRGRLLRIANAHGHLAQFWQAVASATDGLPGLEPLWDASFDDPRLEQRLADLAAERFAEVEITYLERAVTAGVADALALFESHRARFAALPEGAWVAAGAALADLLSASSRGRPFRLDLRLAVVRAANPLR